MGSARVRHALRRFLRGSRAAYRGDLGVRWAALSGKILLALHGQDTRARQHWLCEDPSTLFRVNTAWFFRYREIVSLTAYITTESYGQISSTGRQFCHRKSAEAGRCDQRIEPSRVVSHTGSRVRKVSRARQEPPRERVERRSPLDKRIFGAPRHARDSGVPHRPGRQGC